MEGVTYMPVACAEEGEGYSSGGSPAAGADPAHALSEADRLGSSTAVGGVRRGARQQAQQPTMLPGTAHRVLGPASTRGGNLGQSGPEELSWVERRSKWHPRNLKPLAVPLNPRGGGQGGEETSSDEEAQAAGSWMARRSRWLMRLTAQSGGEMGWAVGLVGDATRGGYGPDQAHQGQQGPSLMERAQTSMRLSSFGRMASGAPKQAAEGGSPTDQRLGGERYRDTRGESVTRGREKLRPLLWRRESPVQPPLPPDEAQELLQRLDQILESSPNPPTTNRRRPSSRRAALSPNQDATTQSDMSSSGSRKPGMTLSSSGRRLSKGLLSQALLGAGSAQDGTGTMEPLLAESSQQGSGPGPGPGQLAAGGEKLRRRSTLGGKGPAPSIQPQPSSGYVSIPMGPPDGDPRVAGWLADGDDVDDDPGPHFFGPILIPNAAVRLGRRVARYCALLLALCHVIGSDLGRIPGNEAGLLSAMWGVFVGLGVGRSEVEKCSYGYWLLMGCQLGIMLLCGGLAAGWARRKARRPPVPHPNATATTNTLSSTQQLSSSSATAAQAAGPAAGQTSPTQQSQTQHQPLSQQAPLQPSGSGPSRPSAAAKSTGPKTPDGLGFLSGSLQGLLLVLFGALMAGLVGGLLGLGGGMVISPMLLQMGVHAQVGSQHN